MFPIFLTTSRYILHITVTEVTQYCDIGTIKGDVRHFYGALKNQNLW